jgi:hypothetical protein
MHGFLKITTDLYPTNTPTDSGEIYYGINKLYGAETFLRNRQSLSYTRNFQHFMKTEGLLPFQQEPSTDPYPEPDQSNL